MRKERGNGVWCLDLLFSIWLIFFCGKKNQPDVDLIVVAAVKELAWN